MKTFKINEINEKRILGRNVPDCADTEKPLNLFWGASALEVNVKAKEIWVKLSSDYENMENWAAVECNGALVCRFEVPKEPQWFCIGKNLNPEKENLFTIMKDTQPIAGTPRQAFYIHEIGIEDGGQFCPLKPRELNIEFIGDSITSGEGLAGAPEEMDWICQWMSASQTYGVKTAHRLNASWSCVSQSGWGICWSWDGNRNGNIPAHYENICSLQSSDFAESLGSTQKYDFGVKNDFVVVNLGTNDNGAFDQAPWKDENGVEHPLHKTADGKACKEDGNVVKQGVINFLKLIRSHNPSAKIIWCWGMIKISTVTDFILEGIKEYKEESGDKSVFYIELDSMDELEVLPEDKGSRGHPGPKTHTMAAEKLTELIRSLR